MNFLPNINDPAFIYFACSSLLGLVTNFTIYNYAKRKYSGCIHANRMDNEERDRIAQMIKEGKTTEQIAKITQRGYSAISRVRKEIAKDIAALKADSEREKSRKSKSLITESEIDRIRYLAEKKKLTRVQIAQEVDRSYSTVKNILNPKNEIIKTTNRGRPVILSGQQIKQIYELADKGLKPTVIAKQMDIPYSTAYYHIYNKKMKNKKLS